MSASAPEPFCACGKGGGLAASLALPLPLFLSLLSLSFFLNMGLVRHFFRVIFPRAKARPGDVYKFLKIAKLGS
jgi:hypothetical protein